MLPTVDLDKLRAFYLVTKYGKFSLAARELGISNGGVTRQVQKLEKQLSCQLLERGGPGTVRLTEKGAVLERLTHELFRQVAEIEPMLAATDNLFEGPLTLAIHSGHSIDFFSSCISEFIEAYPKINFNILSNDTLFDVDIREADVVIRPWSQDTSDLVQRHLFSFNLNLYASKSYIEKFGMPETAEDLKNHRLLAVSADHMLHSNLVNWHLKLGTDVAYKPYMVSNCNLLSTRLIQDGVCIGSTSPEFLGGAKSKLVPVLPHLKGPKVDVYFIHGQQYINSKKVNTLFEFLKKRTSKLLEDR
jgi:DNA-binding transcriptional LysR family regulator